MTNVAKIEQRAVVAYFKRMERAGFAAQQPARTLTTIYEDGGKHFVKLANVNGDLATYRIHDLDGDFRLEWCE